MGRTQTDPMHDRKKNRRPTTLENVRHTNPQHLETVTQPYRIHLWHRRELPGLLARQPTR